MKQVFKKVGDFFVKLFGGVKKAEKWLEQHIPEAIELINKIINTASNPVLNLTLDTILNLLPENIRKASKEVQAKALKSLADAVRILNINHDCLTKSSDVETILCYMEVLKKRSPVDLQATATKTGSLYLQQQNPELKLSDTDTALQMTFKAQKIDAAA